MSNVIIKKDHTQEEQQEQKNSKKGFIQDQVSKTGKPLGKIYPGRIRSVLRGESPVISKGYGANTSVSRVDGETWKDLDGKVWKKENGLVTRIDNEDILNIMVDVRKYLALPAVCPRCGNIFKDTPLNRKFWSLDKQCFNCSAEDHTKMKIAGTWTKFEETKLLENERDYLIDIREMIKDTMKNELKEVHQYVNEDGSIEKWDNPNYTEQKKFFENEIAEITKRLEEIDVNIKKINE